MIGRQLPLSEKSAPKSESHPNFRMASQPVRTPLAAQVFSAGTRHLVRDVRLSPFVRGFLVLSAGTVAAALVMILSAPVISRMYTPAAFGILSIYASVLAFATTAASLRYELAIPIAETDEAAANVAAVSFGLVAVNASILIGVVTLAPRRLLDLLHCPGLSPYLWLIPLAFLFTSVYQIASYWAIRKQGHRHLARTRMSQSVGCAGAQVVIGALHGSAWGLFAGDLIGRAAGSGVILRSLVTSWPRHGVVTARRAWGVMRRYAKFPLMSTAAAIFSTAASQLPVLLLARFFGLEEAGFYALSSRVLTTPASLLGGALGQAFLGHAASLRADKDELRRVTERIAIGVLAFGFPVFLFVMLEGPALFTRIFGQRWLVAGIYAQRLSPWFLVWLVSSPLSQLLTVREWQGTTLVYAAADGAVTVCALAAGVWLKSAQAAVTVLGVAGFILTVFTTSRFLHAGHSSWTRLIGPITKLAACAAAPLAALSLAPVWRASGGDSLIGLGARFALVCPVYGLLVWRLGLYGAPARRVRADA